MKIKKIVLEPYNPNWPILFDQEAKRIRNALGLNCLAVYHIGSTSVPELLAKPVIDMITVVKNPKMAIPFLEALGYEYRGEYNIPMRFFFNLSGDLHVNLHVYEGNHPEIELNLLFRDYLRTHPQAREEYKTLKEELLKEASAHEKRTPYFSGYTLGKDPFIRKILKATHFDQLRMVKASHYKEWETINRFQSEGCFNSSPVPDLHLSKDSAAESVHLVFYKGVEIVGCGLIEFSNKQNAILKAFFIALNARNQKLGTHFLKKCEEWLKSKEVEFLQLSPDLFGCPFFEKFGYSKVCVSGLTLMRKAL